ncbi:MAG: hypothetical protein IGS38_22630 [Synechococcales cyanobacterium M58_A2018_015]|nr:hypothetical protein [Synechococcales cyanobacterium M58_A2018_015]
MKDVRQAQNRQFMSFTGGVSHRRNFFQRTSTLELWRQLWSQTIHY